MTLREVRDALDLELLNDLPVEREVAGGYCSDLLSDVIAHAEEGDIWVTLQIHLNIVAVAAMKQVAGVILTGGRKPNAETLEKATSEGLPILSSELPAFELVGRLHRLGVTGVPPRDEGV